MCRFGGKRSWRIGEQVGEDCWKSGEASPRGIGRLFVLFVLFGGFLKLSVIV